MAQHNVEKDAGVTWDHIAARAEFTASKKRSSSGLSAAYRRCMRFVNR